MKKLWKRLSCFAGVLCMLVMMFTFLAAPAMADATRVVTLGQDLTDEQEAFIINYFGVDLNTARVIYVNNWQEREYLGSWIPLEQIGNITISSAYVQPTNSGGIQVRTANLTYVTGNMIASVLSTAGITNCNVVAAAPFAVSGTGALTGVMIAYQAATGQELDSTKRDLAVQEFTVTQQASGSIGEDEALQLVNAVKMEVIQSDVAAGDTQQIADIVDQVVSDMDQSLSINGNGNQIDSLTMDQSVNVDNSTYYDYSVTSISNGLTEEDRQMLIDLATRIAEQDYDTAAVMETLQRVDDNLKDKTNIEINVSNGNTIDNSNTSTNTSTNNNNSSSDTTVTVEDNEESILDNVNTEVFDINLQSANYEEGMAEIEEKQEEAAQEQSEEPVQPVEPVQAEQPASPESPYDMTSITSDTVVMVPGQSVDVSDNTDMNTPDTQGQTDQDDQMPPNTETVIDGTQGEESAEQAQWSEQTEQQGYVMPDATVSVFDGTEEPAEPEPQPEPEPEPQPQPELPLDETSDIDNADGMDEMNQEISQEPEQTDIPASAGEWQIANVPEGHTLLDEVQASWDKGPASYDGIDLTPMAYLGSRDGDGLDYQIICSGTVQTEAGPEDVLFVVSMHESADESMVSITDMTALDLGELEEASLDGSEPDQGTWTVTGRAEAGVLDGTAGTAFSVLTQAYAEKDLKPIMLLATKGDLDTEYVILCYEAAGEGKDPVFDVAFITAYADGTFSVDNLVPLSLAEYNS